MNITFAYKDDVEISLRRIEAWFHGEMLDRPPIRFAATNAEYAAAGKQQRTADQWKKIWFDAEQVVDAFITAIEDKRFLGETFPVFWPNLGPDVYSAFYGGELTYGEITSWSHPCLQSWGHMSKLRLATDNEYFKKIEELTYCALQKCQSRYFVGHTDFHTGIDCDAAWRGPEQLCFDLSENPEKVKMLAALASQGFIRAYDHFDDILKKHDQPSVTWIGIPVTGKFYVSSCDFATMMSPNQFVEFELPSLVSELDHMTHNVFHMDGRGVARHLDAILELHQISAIQWVQGVGDDEPIMQWAPLIRKIQRAGKGVVIDLKKEELENFISELQPNGIYLCINETDEAVQKAILKRIAAWK